jgi:hypothetical protein
MRHHAAAMLSIALVAGGFLGAARAEDPPPAQAESWWAGQVGDVPFVIGADKGRDEVKLTGQPAMFFFTGEDEVSVRFAKLVWTDRQVVESVAPYTAILVRATDAPQDLKDKFLNVKPPVVAWVDAKERRVFVHQGDADLETFRGAAAKAGARCPAPAAPSARYVPVLEAKKRLDAAAQAKDVRAQLEAIAEIRKEGVGVAVQAAAAAADARLTKEGEAEIERAKALATTAEGRTEAKAAAERLVAVYGAEHAVGKKAAALVEQWTPKPPPKKK